MTGSSSNKQTKVQTRQIILSYNDLVGLFIDAGMAVDDDHQEFDLFVRRSFPVGDRDIMVGRVGSDGKLVLQFNEVTLEDATG